ncbi:MAG: hypothetical protein ABR915_02860 [Thermoguttaceae bacterium]|jgi:hypothetical protein
MNMRRLHALFVALAAVNSFFPAALVAGQPPPPSIATMQIVPGHPWRPPFGLDRVGQPPDVIVTFAGSKKPAGEFVLVGYRQGTEVCRQAVSPTGKKAPYVARISLDAGPAEVVLLVKSSPGGEPKELARQTVTLPPFEADAVARPETVIHPVDLGTILVPHEWLLLAGGQTATVEVAALNRGADVPGARAIAWYESVPGEKAMVPMPLKPGEKAQVTLVVGAGARAEKKDALHVTIADAQGKVLWQKVICVMRVPAPPPVPRFGAISTKLRYDVPIPARYKPYKINYDEGWDPKLNDVVVFLPNGARFVFWRGSSYCPFWAGRSNTGLCYEWAEIIQGHGIQNVHDCVEPLQDKELRYGRVEIIESTPARVHVRWSYQSCDLDYKVGGSFAAEDYIFYPDGFGTRVLTLTANPGNNVETQEFIIFTPQSGYPFDYVPENLVDMLWPEGKAEFRFPCVRGEQQEAWAKLKVAGKDVPLLHRIRFGRHEPLAAICYSPWGSSQDLPGFAPFTDGGVLVTPMYWGCHWPLSRGYPTGWAISDRIHETPGHNSSFHTGSPKPLRTRTGEVRDAEGKLKTMQRDTWVWLIGMTDADDDALRRWAKSFALAPPTLDLAGARLDADSYAPERRALRLVVEKPAVTITLKPAGHCVNPVFELSSAPKALKNVRVDGNSLDPARYAWDGKTLWLDVTLSRPAEVLLEFGGGRP